MHPTFSEPPPPKSKLQLPKLPTAITSQFSWVLPRAKSFTAWKPVIRSAIAAWVSLILLIVPRTERMLGQASFLILVGAFLSPPNEPFVAIVQREFSILFLVALAWAWSTLGIKFASMSRSELVYNASTTDIFAARYIELAPSIISCLFLSIGSSFFVYVKARVGPGPYVFAVVFSCITIDICMTTSALFPYPYYAIGQAVIVPLACHSAISIVCSALILPETINALFIKRLRAVFTPLSQVIRKQCELLQKSPFSPEFDPTQIRALAVQAEAALLPLSATAQLLKRDFSWGRFGGSDLRGIRELARRLVVRADGIAFFYRIIDPLRDPFPITPAVSRPPTRPPSPVQSSSHAGELDGSPGAERQTLSRTLTEHESRGSGLAPSITSHSHRENGHSQSLTPLHSPSPLSAIPSHFHASAGHHHRRRLHLPTPSIISEKLHHSSEVEAGTFESQHYYNLEMRLHIPNGEFYTTRAVALLSESCNPMLIACADSLDCVVAWLSHINASRFRWPWDKATSTTPPKDVAEALAEMEKALKVFRTHDRLRVLQPYMSEDGKLLDDPPPHRYLFHCFVYQFHLMEFGELLVSLLTEISRLDHERTRPRLWVPTLPWRQWAETLFKQQGEYEGDGDDDENPDTVLGVPPESESDQSRTGLEPTQHRNPDALPPSNALELIGTWIFQGIAALGRGNVLFAIKSAVLTALMSLPTFMHSSAELAYRHKWVWAIIMAQLTLSRFRGDTTFNWVARVTGSFIGGIIGMVVWYISTGDGQGNYYGLAATCVVFFPLLSFYRIYYPGPPITTLLTSVTVVLVIGYSWQDTHYPTPGSPGYGFDVAWRRFLLVAIGVTGAFIFSLLPPSRAIRIYHRVGLSTAIVELGNIFCSVLSQASTHDTETRPQLVKNLILIRSKLKRSKAQSQFASYEISLRGKWPKERYTRISDLEVELAYLLSHVYTVILRLDDVYSYAFRHRTRIIEPDFLGQVLSIISMCAGSLRNGTPLPQITPAPLVDRFLEHNLGLEIMVGGNETSYGVPRAITAEVLADEQYMAFCVGVASMYGVVMRLDKLTFAIKQLVGENFHIDGVDLPFGYGGRKVED